MENVPPGYSFHRYHDFKEPLPDRVLCMSVETDDEAWMQGQQKRFPDFEYLLYTNEAVYRIANPGAKKVDALQVVCRHYGFSMENVIAFGDDVNDVEMLKKAGFGVAMKNAVPQAKDGADLVLQWSNEEDGVARFLEEKLLV